MEDTLFNTEIKQRIGVENMQSLRSHPGWILLTKMLKANLVVINQQILDGCDTEQKAELDRLRDRRKLYKEVLSIPEKVISDYGGEKVEDDTDVSDYDPYDDVDDIEITV